MSNPFPNRSQLAVHHAVSVGAYAPYAAPPQPVAAVAAAPWASPDPHKRCINKYVLMGYDFATAQKLCSGRVGRAPRRPIQTAQRVALRGSHLLPA